jgi:hypothetical protein
LALPRLICLLLFNSTFDGFLRQVCNISCKQS